MSARPTGTGAKPRHLIPSSVVLASTVGFCGALYFLFPDSHRTLDLAARHQRDALSIAYLRVLLRTDPDNYRIRYSLANELAETGQWEEARRLVAPLAYGTAPSVPEARLALLHIDRAMMRQSLASDPRRTGIRAGIAEHIEKLLSLPVAPKALETLAEASQEIDRPDLAARALQRLADLNPAGRRHWLELTARNWLAHGQPLKAAIVYRTIAMSDGQTMAARRNYVMLALDNFVASNNGAAALAFADEMLGQFGTDPVFLDRALVIAQTQNDVHRAQRFGRPLLMLSPEAVPALERQLDIELSASALPEAMVLATRLVALAPDVQHRTRLAQIADWNSSQEVAMKQWAILALGNPSGAAMERALQIAHARDEDKLWLELIGKATHDRDLTADEQATLLAIAQRASSSRDVVDFLSAYCARRTAPVELWIALSEAQVLTGDLDAGIATLRRMPPSLIGPVEAARREAILLERAGRPGDGLARLRTVRAQAGPGDERYLVLLGNLAWQADSRAEAVHAYQAAWKGNTDQVHVAERLIEADNAHGEYEDAIAVAREAYRRFDEPRWLLLAMDSASRAQRWNDLRALLASAKDKPGQFEQLEMYWLLAGRLAQHDGKTAAARTAYHRALALNPASVSDRVNLLWFEIDDGDPVQLSGLIQKWESEASTDPAYWAPYAAGLKRLHRSKESLPWFERQLRAKPDEPAWTLEYAEALSQAGRGDDAVALRRAAYEQLRPQFQKAQQLGTPLAPPLMLSYAGLVREFEGDAAAQGLLIDIIQQGNSSGPMRELLVDSLLAQKKYDSARSWLRRTRFDQGALPARQYLALAQVDNDRAQIAAILDSPSSHLSAVERVSGLQQLGRNTEALQLAEAAARDSETADNPWLAEMTTQLRWKQSKRGGIVAEKRQIGNLDLRMLELNAGMPVGDARATVKAARMTLGGSSAAFLRDRSEEDLSAAAEWQLADGDAGITVGTNHRRQDSLFYGRAEWTGQLGPAARLRLGGSANMLSEESGLMRAIGKKSKLDSSVTIDLGDSRYAQLGIAGQRYATRDGERLGSGYRLEGGVGTSFRRKDLIWQVRLSASWEHNRLADSLPASLRGVVPPSTLVSEIVPQKFAWAGVGSTLFFGDQDSVPGHWHGLVDGILGEQWPDRRLGYSVRAMLAVPLAARNELRFEAFHSNVRSNVTAASNNGIRFSYQHQF